MNTTQKWLWMMNYCAKSRFWDKIAITLSWCIAPEETQHGSIQNTGDEMKWRKTTPNIEALASFLCKLRGYDPAGLEYGDVPCEDGICQNGDPGHFLWRQFMPEAVKIINFMST